jgi:tetratricopeptide (TPR) repeat protein
MKIFLSYGHDNTSEELVKRIKTDLSALGHDVWLDRDRIDFGDDWRREITDGIIESDQVLAFLSQHSTRDSGVCRDEISIALGAGKAYVFTILVQPEQEVDLPLSVSHLQWLDMHDWQQRQQEPAQFEVWYLACLAKIIEVIDHPDNQRFAGEISQLEQYLKPLDCTADIVSRVQKFTGREWLIEELNQWREGDRHSRVFWLSGGPGVGKSAVAAWLAHSNRAQVIAVQFCRYNSPERREPTRVIRSIAFQLATRLPDYRRHLMYQPEIADLDRKNPAELFDYLLANPLRYAINGNRSRHLIVLDALDESLKEGKSELTELIAAEIHKLPDWIGWVVTSRPEAPIRRQLEQFGIHEINADDPRNQQDIASYVDEWLSKRGLVDDELLQTQAKVIEAAQGNFLYLRQLELAVEQNIIDLKQLDDLPKGLSALFAREFSYRFADLSAYEKDILPLLEIMVASSRPIPEADIENILNCSKRQRIRLIEQLGSFVNQTPDGIALFHKSLKDWLVDEASAGADYFVEVDNGHQVLGKVLWEQFTQVEDLVSQFDTYMTKEMPEQLTHCNDQALLKLIGQNKAGKDVKKIRAVMKLKILPFSQHQQQEAWGWGGIRICELCYGVNHPKTAAILESFASFLIHIAHYVAVEPIIRRVLVIREMVFGADHPATGRSLDALGVLLKKQGDYAAAEPLNRRALAIAEQALGPDHPATGTRLNNLGGLLNNKGDYVEAEPLLRRALAITELALGPDHPTTGTRLNNLGLLLKDMGDYVEAEPLFRRALAITEQALGPEHPYTGTHLNNLGLLLKAKGDYVEAEPLYRRALAITEQALGPDHPTTGSSLNNLGGLLRAKGDYEAAEPLYRRALAITEQALGPDHPETGTRLNNLGLLLKAKGDYVEAEPLYRRALAISEKALGPDHPTIGTRLNSLGLLLKAKGDYVEAEPLLRRALAITEQALGPDHPTTGTRLNNLGLLLKAKGDYVEAEPLYRRALAITEQALGPDHP